MAKTAQNTKFAMCFSSDHQPQASPPPREVRDASCMRQCEVGNDACLRCARESGTRCTALQRVRVGDVALQHMRVGDEDDLEASPSFPGCCHVHVPAAGPRPWAHRSERALAPPYICAAAHIAAAPRRQRCRPGRFWLRFGLRHGASEPKRGLRRGLVREGGGADEGKGSKGVGADAVSAQTWFWLPVLYLLQLVFLPLNRYSTAVSLPLHVFKEPCNLPLGFHCM